MSTKEPGGNPKVNTQLEQLIAAMLGERPIAYYPILARSLKSVTGAIFLSQLLYWTPRTKNPDGWVYKTRADIHDETALTRDEQETARKALLRVRVIEEKRRGVPATMHYRVNMPRLRELLMGIVAQPPVRPAGDETPSPTPA